MVKEDEVMQKFQMWASVWFLNKVNSNFLKLMLTKIEYATNIINNKMKNVIVKNL